MKRIIGIIIGILLCCATSCMVFVNGEEDHHRTNGSSADTITIIMSQNPTAVNR
jgi:hypothetical protein